MNSIAAGLHTHTHNYLISSIRVAKTIRLVQMHLGTATVFVLFVAPISTMNCEKENEQDLQNEGACESTDVLMLTRDC